MYTNTHSRTRSGYPHTHGYTWVHFHTDTTHQQTHAHPQPNQQLLPCPLSLNHTHLHTHEHALVSCKSSRGPDDSVAAVRPRDAMVSHLSCVTWAEKLRNAELRLAAARAALQVNPLRPRQAIAGDLLDGRVLQEADRHVA